MTTKITIDPALVREVLGIEDWEHEKYCDNAFRPKDEEPYNMVMTDDNIQFQNCCECYFEGLQGIKGATFLAEEPEVDIDIHRFKDLAIEWCAGKGYETSRINHCKGAGIVYATIGGVKLGYTWGCEGADCATYIEAELEMLNDVWEQIQKEKKDEN